MYFFVFATYVFLFVFFFGIVWVLNINKYSSNFNCNECKYCILELKMEVFAQEAIFHVLYTNPENFQILSRRSST